MEQGVARICIYSYLYDIVVHALPDYQVWLLINEFSDRARPLAL